MFDEGFDFVLEKIELKYLVPFQKRWRFPKKEIKEVPLGIRLRRLAEKLGPTFVKFGQILSLRPDLVGKEIAEELGKLQDRVAPFSSKIAKEIVQQELVTPPIPPLKARGGKGELFKKFEEKPRAAASLAQVHRAISKNGDTLALKIQRPNIRETIEQDIHLMLHLAKLLEKIPEIALRQPVALVKEFADSIMKELDFELEGQRYDRFRLTAEKVRGAKVPKVYWEYTTPKLLTMEYVEGIRISDIKALKKEGIEPKNLAKIGFEVLLRQIFIDGIFQADPHPGNFFALKNERGEDTLCFHDFGMVGYLAREDRDKMLKAISAFVQKDAEEFLERVMEFVSLEEGADITASAQEIQRNREGFLREARTIVEKFIFSADTKSVVVVLPEVLRIGFRYRIIFPTNFALLARSLFVMSNVGLMLDPDFDINEAARKFINRAILEKIKPKKLFKELPEKFFDYAEFLKQLPERTQKLLEKIEKGEINVKINLQEIKNLKAELDRENDIRIFSIVTAMIFLGSVILAVAGSAISFFGIPLGHIGLGVSGLMVLWLIGLVRQKAR